MKHRRDRKQEAVESQPVAAEKQEQKEHNPDSLKPKKKWLISCIAVGSAAVLIAAFLIAWPYIQHSRAKSFLANQDYESAIVILDALVEKGHSGSDVTLSDAHHQKAEALVAEGKHPEALEYAQTYPCFTDEEVAEFDRNERYHRALTLMEKDETLPQAQALLAELADYRDSADHNTQCLFRLRVIEAQGYADTLDFERAMTTLLADPLTKEHENIALYENGRLQDLTLAQEELSGKIASGAFFTLTAGQDAAAIYGQALHLDAKELAGEHLIAGAFSAASLNDGKLNLSGYTLLNQQEAESWMGVADASIGVNHLLAVMDNGTVKAIGQDEYGKLAVSEWKNVQDVAAGLFHSVAFLSDGTAVAVGENSWGQCDVAEWKNLTQVAAGFNHTLGLKADGTVVACGENADGQCDVSSWKNVVRIYASGFNSYALCADGTILACGDNSAGQCEVDDISWVAELAPGLWNLAVMHRDGSVSFVGRSRWEQKDAVGETRLLRFEAQEELNGESLSDVLCEKVLWPVDKNNGPWLYAAEDMMVVITLHYEEDCRSRFYTSHIYTAGGTDKLIDGFWTENGRGIAHPQKIARKYQAIYAQNCNYPYDPENDWRGPDIRNGKVMKKSMGPDFFYVDKAGNMVTALTRAEEWNFDKVEALGVEHVYGFGPTLVQKGVLIDEKHMRTSGVYGNNPRSAFGSVEIGHYVGIVVDGRKPGVSVGVNLTRLGEQFLKIGCTEAYNLDGGQSSCMLFMGEMVTNHNGESMFNGQRILPDMLIWGTSDLSLSLE